MACIKDRPVGEGEKRPGGDNSYMQKVKIRDMSDDLSKLILSVLVAQYQLIVPNVHSTFDFISAASFLLTSINPCASYDTWRVCSPLNTC